MRVSFRPPTLSDLDAIAASMRPMDVKECEVVLGAPPREALSQCVAKAEWASVAEVDGKPVCIFGLTDDETSLDGGFPWMLSTDAIERHARIVLTVAPRFVGEMRAARERLANIVHAHNHSAIRFLKWCGFAFGETVKIKGEPFLQFYWERPI